MSRLRTLALFVLLAAASPDAFALDRPGSEWPQFRGPNRDAHSPDTGLLPAWPKNGPPLLWKASGIGSGFSSVALADGRLYTMGNKQRPAAAKGKKGAASFVVAVDADSGKVLWSQEVGEPGGNLGCTPTTDGDRVYAIGQAGDLVCLDAATGAVKWRKNFQKDFGGHCGGWRYTESPLIDGDRLVCTPGAKDATMVALDKKTGEVLWKCAAPVADPTAGYSSVVIAEVGGVRQYVQLLAGGVIGVAARDGKFLWKYEKLGHNTANIPTPIVLGDEVFCCAGYGKGGALLRLVPDGDGVTAKEVWFNRAVTNKHGGLVAVGDYVYGDQDDHGRPFCVEVKTGKVVWQRKREDGPGEKSASVAYADGHLYVRYEDGVTALVEASSEGYKQVGAFKIPRHDGPSWAHPVIAGGRMYLREGDAVYCYDVRKP